MKKTLALGLLILFSINIAFADETILKLPLDEVQLYDNGKPIKTYRNGQLIVEKHENGNPNGYHIHELLIYIFVPQTYNGKTTMQTVESHFFRKGMVKRRINPDESSSGAITSKNTYVIDNINGNDIVTFGFSQLGLKSTSFKPQNIAIGVQLGPNSDLSTIASVKYSPQVWNQLISLIYNYF